MIWKFVTVVFVLLMLLIGFSFFYQNVITITPVELKINYIEPERVKMVDYGKVPVFAENLRFNHNLISYFIEEDCDEIRREKMLAAFNIFSEEVKVIAFYEGDEDSDIKVGCSNEFIELGENLFAAGEGGPSKIINTSLFKVIEEGRIELYNGEDCDYPIVALHELGHVFGFAHSEDPANIMYNVSRCDQRMSADMAELMRELYLIEALADARISELDAVLHGNYLDFNISILNEGLIGIDDIDLTILSSTKDDSGDPADGEEVEVIELGKIELGYGRTLRIKNMRMPWRVKEIKFVVDEKNLVRELREDNNFLEMRIP